MENQTDNQSAQTATIPGQVWATLTPGQQKEIRQTIVQLCQRLIIQHQNREKKDDPSANVY